MIEEIPKSYRYTCDACRSATHVQHNAGGHYTNSVPPAWAKVRYVRALDEEQNLAGVCDEFLLCPECRKPFEGLILIKLPKESQP